MREPHLSKFKSGGITQISTNYPEILMNYNAKMTLKQKSRRKVRVFDLVCHRPQTCHLPMITSYTALQADLATSSRKRHVLNLWATQS